MDRKELAEWLERVSVVAEAEGFRSVKFHVDKLREIVAALRESEEWRRDAERWQWSVANARWLRHEHEAYVAIPVALGANLSCLASRVAAIDAARKEGV